MKIQVELTPAQWQQVTGAKFDTLSDRFPELFDDTGLKPDADLAPVISELVKDKTTDYGKRQWSQSRRAIESRLKKLGVEDFEKAEEGLDKLIEQLEADAGKDPIGSLKDEDIKKHPAFKTAVAEHVADLRTKLEETKAEHEKYKAQVEGQQKRTVTQQKFAAELDRLKAGYGAKGKETALQRFFAAFPDISVNEKGNVVGADGEEILSDLSPVSVSDFLKNEWDYGFDAAPGNPAPPKAGDPPAPNKGAFSIKSTNDYNEIMKRPGLTREEKTQAAEAYKEYLAKQE